MAGSSRSEGSSGTVARVPVSVSFELRRIASEFAPCALFTSRLPCGRPRRSARVAWRRGGTMPFGRERVGALRSEKLASLGRCADPSRRRWASRRSVISPAAVRGDHRPGAPASLAPCPRCCTTYSNWSGWPASKSPVVALLDGARSGKMMSVVIDVGLSIRYRFRPRVSAARPAGQVDVRRTERSVPAGAHAGTWNCTVVDAPDRRARPPWSCPSRRFPSLKTTAAPSATTRPAKLTTSGHGPGVGRLSSTISARLLGS